MNDGKLQLDAKKLKSLRKKSGLSQEALANRCFAAGQQISLATIKRAELGRPILYRTAKCLASYYNTTLEDIIVNTEDKTTQSMPNDELNANIVGRSFELKQLEQVANTVESAESGSVVYIRGVAGIGKTHLINTFLAKLPCEQFHPVTICLSSNKNSNWTETLAHILTSLLDVTLPLDTERDINELEKTLKNKGFNQGEIFHIFSLINIPVPSHIKKCCSKMSYFSISENENKILLKLIDDTNKTVVLVVEDIHWASSKLLLTLRYLCANLNKHRALLLLSSRMENDPLDSIWRSSIINTPFFTMDIIPLTPRDAESLTKAHPIEDEKYIQQCINLAEGNPLFLKQLLFNYPQRLGATPSSITELTITRLKGLSPADQEAVCAASVIGDSFSFDELAYTLNRKEFNTENLINSYFIYPIENNDFRFSHALIRQGVYDSIDTQLKSFWHERLAQWFKDRNPVNYAFHLSKVRHTNASEALANAAQNFLKTCNYSDALNLIDQAISLNKSPQEQYQLLITKGFILQRLDLAEKSITLFQQAHQIAQTNQDKAESEIALASALLSAGRETEADEKIKKTQGQYAAILSEELGNRLKQIADAIENSKHEDCSEAIVPDYQATLEKLTLSSSKELTYANKKSGQLSPVKVGILHSLSGFLKELEEGVLRATLLAISEINNHGGLLGRPILPIIEDSGSNAQGFEDAVKKLIDDEHIVSFFGCSTSSSRKRVKPIIEQAKQLLVYPFQYEGIETSENIAYVGPAPNQQALPAVDWLLQNNHRKFFLVGSDYIYPRVTNKLIDARLKEHDTSEVHQAYVPLGETNFTPVVKQIKHSNADTVIITLVGLEANKAFFKELHKENISPKDLTVLSLVLSENDLCEIPTDHVVGVYTLFSYFQNIDSPINEDFVRKYKHAFGKNARIGGYMESAYTGVHLWAKAVQKSGSFTPSEIIQSMKGISLIAPGGIAYFDENNNHVWRKVRLARVGEDGEYHIEWESDSPIPPSPFPLREHNIDWEVFIEEERKILGEKWENSLQPQA
ncbi:transporter substrate-binding protein [Teredinibacter sp. KSP-S5-2]|uniref:transporter substrate-binding protein n=1 Tax=Teredinibacter sp. KSP-S5-2 TaxID=3034506 RepID=UPI002934A7AF|nr:transporter substrate-binding protein [Teredinibacter sp. KSP-S5-2]WNO07719.1 transporter substrate-binding protein [Teredinibacter sp. KSP-S5-2]